MATKSKTAVTENAKYTLPLELPPHFASMVTTVRQQVATIQQCADYATSPTVQVAADTVLSDASELDAVLVKLVNARALVRELEGQRNKISVTLHRNHGGLVTTLNVICAGVAQSVLKWGGKLLSRVQALVSEAPVPVNARFRNAKTSGTLIAACDPDKRAYAYLFQFGTTQANPEAWPAPTMESGSRHTMVGQTIGQTLYCRIAIVRRGQEAGPWSTILSVTVH